MGTNYELVFIVDTQLEEAEIEARITAVQNLLTNGGAEIANVDRWGNRRLAYEINNSHQGFYVLMQFAAEGSLIRELERQFRLDAGILRYLVVLSDGPTPSKTSEQEPTAVAEEEENTG